MVNWPNFKKVLLSAINATLRRSLSGKIGFSLKTHARYILDTKQVLKPGTIFRALDVLLTSIHRSYSDMVFNVTRQNESKLNAIVEVGGS